MSEVERNRSTRPEERHAQILGLLARQTVASLADVQAATGASIATTRRDLTELANHGLVERTRGGARLIAQDSSLDESFGHRQHRHARAKGAIAQTAAELVQAGTAIFLNDGSTTFALAQALAHRKLKLWVATCALNIAELLARNGAIEVVVIGGSLRRTSFGTIGPLATNAIHQLHADIAFLGCDGVHIDAGVRSNSVYDAEIARTMAANADQTILVADSSKLGNKARSLIAPLAEIDHWITDRLDPEIRDQIPTRTTTASQQPPNAP